MNFNTYGMDCNGTCNGNKQIDNCGHCLELNDINWNNCSINNFKSTIIYIDDPAKIKIKTEIQLSTIRVSFIYNSFDCWFYDIQTI